MRSTRLGGRHGSPYKQKGQGRRSQGVLAAERSIARVMLPQAMENWPNAILNFNCTSCGMGKKWKHVRYYIQRRLVLTMLKLLSPPLPLALEAVWARIRDAYAKHSAKMKKEPTGFQFKNRINVILKDLAIFYRGTTKYNKKGATAADKQAFEKFAIEMSTWISQSMCEVEM